jgi:nicotinate-nucleotide pyrophosphorylase (carboxylating)
MQQQRPERRGRSGAPRMITPLSVPAMPDAGPLRFPLDMRGLETLVRAALDEDGAFNDITTIATVVSERRARAKLAAKEAGVVAGVPLAVEAFRLLDPKVSIRIDTEDGTRVTSGDSVLFITGHARPILAAERVALNFLQRLSGIASLAAAYVDAVRGTKARILDTRKTTPGWRALEKYAVRAGTNHRLDLASAVLIKDNHLAALDGDIALGVRRARETAAPGTRVEVECDRGDQVEAAVRAGADVILLDNMSPAEMRECVSLVGGRALVEASGGVTLWSVREIAETGVDWISVGAITHSAPAMDLAVEFE